MALIVCHECKAQISSEAKACPQCGAPVVSPSSVVPPYRGFGKVLSSLLMGIVVVGLVYIVVIAPPSAPPRSPSAQGVSDPFDQTGCSSSRRAVEARLTSPSSAKWVSCRSTTSSGIQSVTLVVESQNALGAMVRSTWLTAVKDNSVQSVAQIQ